MLSQICKSYYTLTDFFTEKEEKARSEEFITIKEAAILLGVAELTVRNYITQGSLKAERIGRRIRIRKGDLKEVKSLKNKR